MKCKISVWTETLVWSSGGGSQFSAIQCQKRWIENRFDLASMYGRYFQADARCEASKSWNSSMFEHHPRKKRPLLPDWWHMDASRRWVSIHSTIQHLNLAKSLFVTHATFSAPDPYSIVWVLSLYRVCAVYLGYKFGGTRVQLCPERSSVCSMRNYSILHYPP